MKISFFHEDIKTFLDVLEDKMRAKVNATIKLLSMPYSRKVEKNLYELRISSIQNIRIFYTFHDNKIVLLHAIYKKTDKLPLHDLNTARHRLYSLHF